MAKVCISDKLCIWTCLYTDTCALTKSYNIEVTDAVLTCALMKYIIERTIWHPMCDDDRVGGRG